MFSYMSNRKPLEAKLPNKIKRFGKVGLSCLKTLRSRRFLARSRAVTVVASLKSELRGWELSTAASDAERERVFEQDSPTFPDSTTYRGVSPQIVRRKKSPCHPIPQLPERKSTTT